MCRIVLQSLLCLVLWMQSDMRCVWYVPYCSAKFAMFGLMDAVRYEVCVVCAVLFCKVCYV